MNQELAIYLVKYLTEGGQEFYTLVNPEALGGEGQPTFDIDGVSIFNILSVEPYSV